MEAEKSPEQEGRSVSREMEGYASYLDGCEKSPATVEKYTRYARAFLVYLDGAEATREGVLKWKKAVTARYTAAGANGMIAAVNSFVAYLGRPELKVAALRVQRRMFTLAESELGEREFKKLVSQAEHNGGGRLSLVMRTLLATGIRVSELGFITAEAVTAGHTEITLKGKTRAIFLTPALCAALHGYALARGITRGPIFVTRTGKPLDRFSIWRGMKKLCGSARVAAKKVFPHNLRKLFARIFYSHIPKLARLADVLGHSNVNTTRAYTALSGESLREQLSALPLML
ncbi:MAG: tyrosine-type recombinase/integrase [Oscillospiraceae bacterium]|jgi:integrase|nr:tyrosine-type recombinase/integrase [Oscillospiraceae bacterium]